jgi:hypothetical protein
LNLPQSALHRKIVGIVLFDDRPSPTRVSFFKVDVSESPKQMSAESFRGSFRVGEKHNDPI